MDHTTPLSRRAWALVLATYIGFALIQSWPLASHLFTHTTGPLGSDTGVYVWNLWAFRHELLDLGHLPFSTSEILAPTGRHDLSLHNYTVFADLVALPLQPFLGLIGTFNIIYIVNIVLAAVGMFVLARGVTGRTAESWLAGLLFSGSPFLIARGNVHFSLTAAAALPLFLHWLRQTWITRRFLAAAATGVAVAWAAYSDPYYAIYCVMLGVIWIAVDVIAIEWIRSADRAGWTRALDVVIVALALGMFGIHFGTGGALDFGSWEISVRSLYTPVLVLTMLALARAALSWRPRINWRMPEALPALVRCGVVSVLVTMALVGPVLFSLIRRSAERQHVSPPVLWRSSAPGVDLTAFVLPNPLHPLAPHWLFTWLESRPGFYADNVASLPFVALLVIAAAYGRARFRAQAFWLVIAIGFAAFSLGPFLHVAGVLTYVPTPWTFLRYVPIIGEARMPARFGVLVILALSVIFAGALAALTSRFPQRRRVVMAIVSAALGFELLAAPRHLYPADLPGFLTTIAQDPRDVRVLNLPFGVRDGLSSLGDFSAESQAQQAIHGKAILGGYLSRIGEPTKDYYRGQPVTRVLMELSEGRTPSPADVLTARASATAFTEQTALGYVVMNTARVSPELRAFAVDTLRLSPRASDRGFELFELERGNRLADGATESANHVHD